ncbi:MAG TPA: NADH-quinone oxidoreductase subunit N [Ohtaekwangia sp.]|nr:NADH-quinone oxidoreductase subunit N [Ohtaekwangia sp.]
MEHTLKDNVELIRMSFSFFTAELILLSGILLTILAGLSFPKKEKLFHVLVLLILCACSIVVVFQWPVFVQPRSLFTGMLQADQFTAYLKLLFLISGILTVVMTWRREPSQQRLPEYYALILAIVLGAHLLVMSSNFAITFIALELISISSYVLAGFAFNKTATEGSLKYFIFGSVASAVMLYGLSFLYGMTGTLMFTSPVFAEKLTELNSPLFFVAGVLTLSGFLYKIAAAPFHPWAPDVYEASPMPIVAFFSVVPKLAGIGILTKFIAIINLFGESAYDWQLILSGIVMLTLTVGNFSALWQKSPKRLMAYSSIAQSGFLLVGVTAFIPQGLHYMLFYATVFVLLNFVVFIYLQYFEDRGLNTVASYSGIGKYVAWPAFFMLVGFVGLTGLPPTAGFTAKLFIFSSLWEAYHLSGKSFLLILLVFGLLNTVVSLFYYLRIPYYAFIKSRETTFISNNLTFENFLGLILVLGILLLFFRPGLLMGWINKINFAF